MPNYDEMVDYVTRKFEDRGQTPDPAAVMRVSARIIKKQGVQVDATHMAGLSDAARRRLVPQEQQGAASALAESAYRSGVVAPIAGMYARFGGDTEGVVANDRAAAQIERDNPTMSYIGSTAGSVAAPFVGTAAGAALGSAVAPGPGTVIGALGGGALASVPYTIANDVSRELQGRGTSNRIGNAALETGFSMIPGIGPAAGTLAKRVGINAVEGALMGSGQSASQQGLDIATGDRKDFSAKEALLSGAGGALAGSAMAPLGGPGDRQAVQAEAKNRQVNMDQLLATQQGDAALADAAANDAAVNKRVALEDAQQQAVAKAQEALSTTPEVASERARIDADIRQAQYEGVAGAIDNTSVADRILRERMAADREAFNAADQEQYAREQAQQDAEMAQRDAEAPPLAEVLPPSEVVSEARPSRSLSDIPPAQEVAPVQTLDTSLESPTEAPPLTAPAPEPRYLVEPATGKARLVTDRMTVDPKETVAYSDLTPEQKNRVDVAAKNLSRRVAGRDVTRSGAAINPAIPLVAGAKAVGRAAKVVRDKADDIAETIQGGVGDATPLARSIRGAQEWLGADMQDRLKKSSNPHARNAGERIGRSIENQHASQGRMHVDRTKALELVAASGDKAAAIRRADEPIKPMDPEQEYTSSRLRNMYEGRTDVPEILRDVVNGVEITNKSTRTEGTDQGLDVVKGDGNNVFVRHKTQEFYNLLDEGAGSWFGQRLIRSLADMNNMDPKKVQELLYPDTKEGRGVSASVRMDAIEQSRKFKNFPQYLRSKDGKGWVRLLETDPTRYVNTTFDAMSRRVGFHKGFGGVSYSADLGNILPGLELAPKSVRETVARAINAFNGEHETSLDMSSGNAIAGLRNAKQIISAMQTSGAAPMDLTETLNIAAHVPITHAFTGVVNSVRKPGRAVQEGGMEADVKNRVDLRGKGTEVSGNVAGALRRGFGRTVVNRAVHAAGYEAGRSWASSLQKNGVALVDEGFLTMNRVSDQMAQRFRDKTATDQDVKVLATMVAENITGQKRNIAQSGRLSRNALAAMVGPLYRRYGENRVRNLIRAVDGAAAIMAKKDQPLAKRAAIASRMLGQSLTATGFSSAAATAVGGALVYGLEALPMYFGSSQGTIPLLVNVLGGGVAGSVLQQAQQPGNLAVTDLASMLLWPFGYASSVANAVSSGKPQNLLPGVSRAMGALSSDDRGGKVAYRAFRSAQSKIDGSTGSGFTANAYRKALHDAVLSGNRDDIREALSTARKAQSPDDFQTFLKRSILLPSDPVKLRKYYNEIGEEAFRKIQAHDATIKKFIDGA
jgi:hypothetical protein